MVCAVALSSLCLCQCLRCALCAFAPVRSEQYVGFVSAYSLANLDDLYWGIPYNLVVSMSPSLHRQRSRLRCVKILLVAMVVVRCATSGRVCLGVLLVTIELFLDGQVSNAGILALYITIAYGGGHPFLYFVCLFGVSVQSCFLVVRLSSAMFGLFELIFCVPCDMMFRSCLAVQGLR
jgi:hypothetical protein